jgi:DNA-binding NarL/FixJ family response regulator
MLTSKWHQYYCVRESSELWAVTGERVNMKRIKIYLSDPQVLFREGIHFILSGEDDFEVTGEATSNEDAYRYIEANPPNIAILNIQDKRVSGPEITRRIKRKFPSIATILTIDKKNEEELFEVMKSGASACLVKDTDPERLLEIIRVVSQGSLPIMEELLTPGLAHRALTEFEDLDALNVRTGNLMAGLTQREGQVLSSIATGSNTEQIADKLNIDEEAVLDNLKSILEKLVANDQTRLVIETLQQSLPLVLDSAVRSKRVYEEYLTREEFTKFKESLAKRLKNIVGEAV